MDSLPAESQGNPVRPLATGNKGTSWLVIFPECFFPLCVPFPCPPAHDESLSECSAHVSLGQSQLAPRGSCLSVFVPGVVDLERNGPHHSVHWQHLGDGVQWTKLPQSRTPATRRCLKWSAIQHPFDKVPRRVPSACVIHVQSAKNLSWCLAGNLFKVTALYSSWKGFCFRCFVCYMKAVEYGRPLGQGLSFLFAGTMGELKLREWRIRLKVKVSVEIFTTAVKNSLILFQVLLCLVTQSCPILCDPMDCNPPCSCIHGDYPDKNTAVGSHALLQEIFPTQGSNPGLPHCRQILYHLSHQGSPWMLEWVAYPFSRGSSWHRNWTRVSCMAGGFFTSWATRETHSSS